MTYKTPGVYTEEIQKLPPSVAGVSTAVPAFVGYTAMAGKDDMLRNKPTKVSTLLEFEALFGEAAKATFIVDVLEANGVKNITSVTPTPPQRLLHYHLAMYFSNGGGPCYIVSVGNHEDPISIGDDNSGLQGGLKQLEKEDEPTLIVIPDAVKLDSAQYYSICQDALTQCGKLKDRFALLDVLETDNEATNFRTNIGTNDLKYGAAYYPYLQTTLSYAYADVTIKETGESDVKLEAIKSSNTALYNQVKLALAQQRVVLPPSATVAGVYAKVDRERGVWKAPANVSLASVIGPAVEVTQAEQDDLNVDANSGKSINVIRSFQGKGTLVWGARTLAGNDNEWRYISVRRLFNTIEESTQKATSFAVFESNDAITWLKVKAMIESYLYGLWQQGALAGSAPELAYYVQIGLGKTMTPQDVLEGRMNVEIGIAAVRPAEFIILKFSHKMQEA